MNKKAKIPLKEYFVTVFVTIILAVSVAFLFQLELLFRCEKKVNFEELSLKNLSSFYTIEQLNKIIQKNPNNSVVYIKIANIYRDLGELKNANEYYKKALVTSSRSNFSLYSYAMFCADNNLINFATSLAEEISANNPKTFEFRARIYELIADKLDETSNFDGANKAYQIAYKYAKNVDNPLLLKAIKYKYAISFTKIADEKIENKETDDAIIDLKNSLKIEQNPIARYKLALIYKDSDPRTAERYLSRVLRENPYLVNPYIYKKILDDLYKKANNENNSSDINYYSNQLKKFKRKLKTAYLFKNDIKIENLQIVNVKKLLNKKQYLLLDVKNNTDSAITTLYFDIEIINNSKTINFEKALITKINPLLQYSNAHNLKVELDDDFKIDDIKNDIYAKIYCKKAKKAPWTLITVQKIHFGN